MKKNAAFLLFVLMVMCLAACGKKDAVNALVDDVAEEIKEAVKEEANDAVNEAVNEVEEAVSEEVEEAVGDVLGHGPDYWCELYGQNRCPFYISCLGIEEKYYLKNGGYLTYWVYTSDNTDGWYLYNDYVISADNKFAIDPEEASNSFSSFCTYEAKPYTGDTLTKEQQKEHLNGVFYVLNPYTPIATNWGIKFFKDSDNVNPDELPESTIYGLTDTLKDQEWFDMYINWNPTWYPEFDGDAVDLWAFPHRDKSEYKELLSDEMKDQSANLGCFDFDEEADMAHLRTFLPNKSGDGLDPGRIDFVITYAGDVVVGLVTVDVLAD